MKQLLLNFLNSLIDLLKKLFTDLTAVDTPPVVDPVPTPVPTPTPTPDPVVVIEPVPPVTPPTPTNRYAVGQHRIGFSKDQLATWQKLKSENHPLYQRLVSESLKTNLYEDVGWRHGILYLLTGDKAYAQTAYTKVYKAFKPSSRNETRHFFVQTAILFDWIKDGLSDTDRKSFKDILAHWVDLVYGLDPTTPYFTNAYDSDEQTGHYFGLACFALSIKDEDPVLYSKILNYVGGTYFGQKIKPFGGFDLSQTPETTQRDMIAFFINRAAGGSWIESSEYNLGTLQYLYLGVEAINYYFKQDKFPEVTSQYNGFASVRINELVQDYSDAFMWGDTQNVHPYLWQRIPSTAIIAGITKSPEALDLTDKLLDKNGTGNLPGVWYPFANPYATRKAVTGVTKSVSTGLGVVYHHSGWGADDSFFVSMIKSQTNVDHDTNAFSNFVLRRKGKWAIKAPRAYFSGADYEAPYLNATLLHGVLPLVAQEVKRSHLAEAGNDYVYHCGVAGGLAVGNNFWSPASENVHEYTRTHFYLHHADGSDTVVLFDRINSDQPNSLSNYDRFRKEHKTAMESVGFRHVNIFNTYNQAVAANQEFTFVAENGETVRIKSFIPDYETQLLNATQMSFGGNFSKPDEKRFQLRLLNNNKARWQTQLNVLHVGSTTGITKITSTSGAIAEGVLVGSKQKL